MKRPVLFRLMFHLCMAVFTITLVIGSSVYFYVNSLLKQEVYASNLEVLGQTKKIVEMVLDDVRETALSLALNQHVQKAVWTTWDMNAEYPFLKSVNQLFVDQVTSSRYIHSIYLYSSNNQKIISNSGIADYKGSWYESNIESFLHERATSSWRDTQPILYEDGSKHYVVSYRVSVPLNDYRKTGVLVINLKEELLYDAVVNTNDRKLGSVFILSDDGSVLSSKDKNILITPFQAGTDRMRESPRGYFFQEIEGENTFISYIASETNGWKYVAVNPAKEVFKESRAVLRITFMISGVCLLFGIGLAVYLSRTYYRPIRNMVQVLDQRSLAGQAQFQYRDEFSYIKESLELLWKQNEAFQEKFKENELILKDHFLLKLLLGTSIREEEMVRIIEHYGIFDQPKRFIVMLLRMPAPKHHLVPMNHILPFQIRSLSEQIVSECATGVVISQVLHDDVVILHFNQDVTKEEACDIAKAAAVNIRAKVEAVTGLTLSVGIGGCYENASGISLSYHEALEALLHERVAGPGSIFSIQDLNLNEVNRNLFITYGNQADELIRELKSGNLEKALEMKNALMEELLNENQIGYRYKDLIIIQLINRILMIVFEWNGQMEDVFGKEYNIYGEYLRQTSLPQVSSWLEGIIIRSYEFIQSKRDNKNADLIERVTEYIKEHFAQPLTLQSVADKIYMNANYFSKLFKEHMGKTFVEYVTEIRLKEACRLLVESDKTIVEIAASSGFGPKLNMIRAFKKYMGLTPSEYRHRNVHHQLENASVQENDTNLRN